MLKSSKSRSLILAGSGAIALMAVSSPEALAVPSFARQTGLACAACHTVFPELTPMGRMFKLDGYVMNMPPMGTVTGGAGPQGAQLALNEIPPLSAMLQVSGTWTKTAQADSNAGVTVPAGTNAQNGTIEFPQQLSFFYAGRISDHMGTFMQFTYSGQDDHMSMDNTDIRYANNTTLFGNNLTYGVTFNNNPTVQDLWNSTPAWGFPYASSDVAPGPAAATQLDGTLGQAVAGLGAYGAYHMGSGMVYLEADGYRSAQVGAAKYPLDSADTGVINGVAPYLRLAYEQDMGENNWEVGLLGFHDELIPDLYPTNTAGNKFTDGAVDGQFQHIAGDNIWTAHAIYIYENQEWNLAAPSSGSSTPGTGGVAAVNANDHLETFRVNGNYYYKRTYGVSAQYFNTWGSYDTGLYTGNASGTGAGSPAADGEIAELDYMPWENTRFALQYTAYNKINGTSQDASNANTLYLLGWFMW